MTRVIPAATVAAVLITSLLAALPLAAQGNPTGTIRGHVTDPGALPLPGVTVTVASATLQGTRKTTTSAGGDFIVPFLPAGDYTVRFDLAQFRTQSYGIGVAMADAQPMQVTLALADRAE